MPEPVLTFEEQCRQAQRRLTEEARALQDQTRQAKDSEDLARLKHDLARTYESIEGKGHDARQTYEDILRHHRTYSKFYEVAYRLGELHTCILLPGTARDPDKAMAYYREAIASSPPGQLIKQQAHLRLGELQYHRREWQEARKNFEEAYRFDPAQLTIDDKGMTPRERAERLRVLRSDSQMIRDAALGMFVAAHRDPLDPAKTLMALGELENKYAGDPKVVQVIQKERDMTLKRGQHLLPSMNSLMSFPGGVRPNEMAPSK